MSLSLYEDRNPVHNADGSQGSAGFYHPEGGKFRIWVEANNLGDPLSLVGTLAHELAHVHLLGQGRVTEDTEDHEPLADLLTVYLGLGIFTANSAFHENYWHEGHYSGWRIGKRGYLGMPVYGYAFAKFAMARGDDGSDWSKELRLDVRSAFNEAMLFFAHEDLGINN